MSLERTSLGILLAIYLVIGGLFALLTPAWQVPDEPAHYNYVRQLAEGRHNCCPIIEPGDWDQDYLDALKAARFDPALIGDLDTIQYENHQPPLYYQIASLIFEWTGGNLIAIRLLSVLLGAGVVVCAYTLSKALLPTRPEVALGAAALVAFLPQHMAMLSAVNNDSLVELLIGITLVVLVHYLKGNAAANRWIGIRLVGVTLSGLTLLLITHRIPTPPALVFIALIVVGTQAWHHLADEGWQVWLLGMLVGLIFVTKSTGYFMAGLVPLAILVHWWPQRSIRRLPLGELLAFLIPALILGGIWWLHNFNTYGFPDFLGLGAHDRVVVDQLRTVDHIAAVGFGPYLNQAITTTFNSFWGQFGWMALPLQSWMYSLFVLLTLVSASGLLIDRFILQRRHGHDINNRPVWVVLWSAIGLVSMMYIYYNLEFLQLQGRYLFYALIPISLVLVLGIDSWRRWLLPSAVWLPVLVFGLLAPFDLYLLLRVIRPLLLP
jgi:4-amino-4-deoxy-L-arabinose transferase-like glycosyltransferase